jgi:hypothetical protein
MKRSSEDIVAEIKKRPPEKPLSLSELANLREVNYIFYKKERVILDLLIQYCCDRMHCDYNHFRTLLNQSVREGLPHDYGCAPIAVREPSGGHQRRSGSHKLPG